MSLTSIHSLYEKIEISRSATDIGTLVESEGVSESCCERTRESVSTLEEPVELEVVVSEGETEGDLSTVENGGPDTSSATQESMEDTLALLGVHTANLGVSNYTHTHTEAKSRDGYSTETSTTLMNKTVINCESVGNPLQSSIHSALAVGTAVGGYVSEDCMGQATSPPKAPKASMYPATLPDRHSSGAPSSTTESVVSSTDCSILSPTSVAHNQENRVEEVAEAECVSSGYAGSSDMSSLSDGLPQATQPSKQSAYDAETVFYLHTEEEDRNVVHYSSGDTGLAASLQGYRNTCTDTQDFDSIKFTLSLPPEVEYTNTDKGAMFGITFDFPSTPDPTTQSLV